MNNGTFYKVSDSEWVLLVIFVSRAHTQCVLSLGFSELRMRNSEHELLDKWSKDHPCERLLDIG